MSKMLAAFVSVVIGFTWMPVAFADSIVDVENARAKDRAGYYVTRQDDEKLDRYGNTSQRFNGAYDDVGSHDYYEGSDIYVGIYSD